MSIIVAVSRRPRSRHLRLWRSESGAGSAEYAGVIGASVLLVAALIGTAGPLGGRIGYDVICTLESLFPGGSGCGGQPSAVPASGSPSSGGVAHEGGGAAPDKKPPVDQGTVDDSLRTIKKALRVGPRQAAGDVDPDT